MFKSFLKRKVRKIILGIIISSYSLMFWIIHLNMVIIGKSLVEYILYSLTHIETLLLFLGLYLIIVSIFKK